MKIGGIVHQVPTDVCKPGENTPSGMGGRKHPFWGSYARFAIWGGLFGGVEKGPKNGPPERKKAPDTLNQDR